MGLLSVYRASAGSGKTFRLAVEYLKLLIREPKAYAHILAVTFTNKATGEMKDRIISELYGLAHDCSPDILKVLSEEMGLNEGIIREQAQKALFRLLHDYSHFRVETIDSFFQSILRNLAKELGLGAYLNIELNNDEVLGEAVDRIIEQTRQDQQLLIWISSYIEEKIGEGKSWRVGNEIKKFGKSVFLEVFQAKERELEKKLTNKDVLQEYRKLLREINSKATEKIKKQGETFFRILNEEGLNIEDFTYGKSGVAGYFIHIVNDSFSDTIVGSRVIKAMTQPEGWVAKNKPHTAKILALASSTLIPLLNKTENIRKENNRIINSCVLSLKEINNLGLLSDISRQVKQLNQDNNRFLLADTAALLRTMIGSNDAPFIYEKTGIMLEHIMIDEFQDTSRMQWENFLPLLMEGISKGKKSLIVGDEKQSIYRWRNGDWRILNTLEQEKRLNGEVSSFQLDTNWRSESGIISFNNALFSEILKILDATYEEQFGESCTELTNAYAGVTQKSTRKEEKGYSEICFPCGEDYDESMMMSLIGKVEELQLSGVAPGDIAILVRKNKFIPQIASYFHAYEQGKGKKNICYTIISDEAFRLDASPAVNILTDVLRFISDQENPVFAAQLIITWLGDICNEKEKLEKMLSQPDYYTYWREVLPVGFTSRLEDFKGMPLSDLLEELYTLFKLSTLQGQESYLYTFFDKVSEYLQQNTSNLLSFLEYWENKMKDVTISAGGPTEGIRISSIHKSKGLEYHTVLIPYCDWKLGSEVNNQTVWCTPPVEPYNIMDLLPVAYGEAMKQSVYDQHYKQETLQLWTDSLNLLYVALTRAKANLILFCKGSMPDKKTDKKKLTTVSDLIRSVLVAGENEMLLTHYNDEEQHYHKGILVKSKREEAIGFDYNLFKQKPTGISLQFFSSPRKTAFRQSNLSRLFISEGTTTPPITRFMERGKLLHELFATIDTTTQIDESIEQFIAEGYINVAEKPEYMSYVYEALSHPDVQKWYDGSSKLFKECTILFKDIHDIDIRNKRPDRIMLSDKGMDVVDFKFGKPSEKYNRQVASYMRLLHRMGYKNITGYIWYVDDKQIEEIKLTGIS